MGTRSIIIVTGTEPTGSRHTCRLYKHWDGYPTDNLRILAEAIGLRPQGPRDLADNICEVSDGQAEQCESRPSAWDEAFDPARHLGPQEDLEWMYVVDTDKMSVSVYSRRDFAWGTSPYQHYMAGVVDPRSYCKQLIEEYRASERERINNAMKDLKKLGWPVVMPASPKRGAQPHA